MTDDIENVEKPADDSAKVIKPSAHGTATLTDNLDDVDETNEATWGEVCRACFCHSPMVWLMIIFRLFWIAFFLYFFIVGLEILGDGAQVLTGCVAGALFGDDQNPVSSLMIGILVTCLLQSSSTTTSIVVTLVGAEAVSVQQGIYMIMGGRLVSVSRLPQKTLVLSQVFFFFSQYWYLRDEYDCCNGTAW